MSTSQANRAGNQNARARVGTTAPGPWNDWSTSSLTARAKRFIETYCAPSKGHSHGQRIKLAQWQLDWLDAVLVPGVESSVLTLPRGNGKSTFIGAVATWALHDEAVADAFGGKPDIPLVAPTLKQAKKGVYGAALDFHRNNSELGDRVLTYTASGDMRLFVPSTQGELYPIAADPDSLQGLDPLMALIDEVGFIDVEAWDALLLSAGKRPRNLILALGTRNPDDVPNALDHLLTQIAVDGSIPGFVLVDYHADVDGDIDDPAQWRKANPALVEGYLRESAIEQARKLSPEPAFKTFRLNLKTGSQTGWLGPHGPKIWDDCEGDVVFSSMEPMWVGVDKSAWNDCSAVVALQKQDGIWVSDARIFLPDPSIDHAAVKDHIRDLCSQYNVEAVGFDERYFVEGAQELEDEGLPLIKVPQTPQRLVAPYSYLYADIVDGRFRHGYNPSFRSHILSAVPQMDRSGGFTLAKGKSKGKIDAAVALGIARAVSGVEHDEAFTDESYAIF